MNVAKKLKVQGLKFKEMNEMEYNGLKKGLRSNPVGLHVYSNMISMGNTTPAGVAQPLYILHFYKHIMPPASILPPKNRGRLLTSVNRNRNLNLLPLTSVNGKETAPLTTGASAPFNAAKKQDAGFLILDTIGLDSKKENC